MAAPRKLLATLALTAMFAGSAMAQSGGASDLLGVPGPIDFGGETYLLSWSSQPSEGYFKQEYVPRGQAVETYTEMFLIEAVLGSIRPVDAAGAQVEGLQQRKEADPVVNYDILHNEATGEVLVDFVLSDLSADPIFVEWNAYRYVPLEGADGLVLYGISRRGYGEDGARALLQGLAAIRSDAIDELGQADLPAVAVAR